MEGIDGLAIVDREGDVEPPDDRPPSRLDPEERLAVAAETGGFSDRLQQHGESVRAPGGRVCGEAPGEPRAAPP